MEVPVYLLSVDEFGEEAVNETSFVSEPATGQSFLAFNKAKKLTFKKIDNAGEYKRITSGIWMLPDSPITRYDDEGNEYKVMFTKESLEQALIKYLKANKSNVTLFEHSKPVTDCVAIEHWIIKDENTKSPVLNLSLEDLGYDPEMIPVGTVMKSTYIKNEEFWNDFILTGEVSGYSIGGMFNLNKLNTMEKVQNMSEEILDEVKEVIEEIVEEQTETTDEVVEEMQSADESTEETEEPYMTQEELEVLMSEKDAAEALVSELTEKLEALQGEVNMYKEQLEDKDEKLENFKKAALKKPAKANQKQTTQTFNDERFKTVRMADGRTKRIVSLRK